MLGVRSGIYKFFPISDVILAFQLPSYLTLVAVIALGLLAIVHSALMIWHVWDLDPLPIIGLYLGFWLWLTGSLIAQTVRLATASMSATTTASVGNVVIQRIWRDGLEYRNVSYCECLSTSVTSFASHLSAPFFPSPRCDGRSLVCVVVHVHQSHPLLTLRRHREQNLDLVRP